MKMKSVDMNQVSADQTEQQPAPIKNHLTSRLLKLRETQIDHYKVLHEEALARIVQVERQSVNINSKIDQVIVEKEQLQVLSQNLPETIERLNREKLVEVGLSIQMELEEKFFNKQQLHQQLVQAKADIMAQVKGTMMDEVKAESVAWHDELQKNM